MGGVEAVQRYDFVLWFSFLAVANSPDAVLVLHVVPLIGGKCEHGALPWSFLAEFEAGRKHAHI
jgi:hypothetical protein